MLLSFAVVVPACAKTDRAVVSPTHVYPVDEGGDVAAYDSRGRGAYILSEQSKLKVCAEPPPDASANMGTQSALKQSIEASAEYEMIKAALNSATEHERSTSSEISDVVARSELVLFMRDALYRICELNLNRVITNEEAHADFRKLLDVARHLGQRDNVGKLIEAYVATVNSPHLEDKERQEMAKELLSAVKALSFVDAVAAGNIGLKDATAAGIIEKLVGAGSSQGSTSPDGTGSSVND